MSGREFRKEGRTIKAAYYWLLLRPLLDYDLDMGIGSGEFLEMVVNVCARVCGGWPFVAVLEDKFAYLWDECDVAVCRAGGE